MSNIQSADRRTVLEGVPRIHIYEGGKRCPEDIIFPSVLRAWLEYTDDKDFGCKHCLARTPSCKVYCTYSFLVGTSGIAAYLSWGDGWQQDNGAVHYMSDDPDAPYRRAFESTGYSYEWIGKDQHGEDDFRRRIQQSLAEGRPVLGFGVVGPPEPSLITGYDDGGDVLIGWSFFQNFPDFSAGVGYEPSGYFRKPGWFKDTDCLAILSAKKGTPDLGKQCREALQWMLQITRTPATIYGKRATGLAAYQAWAGDVLRDDQFPAGDEGALRLHHQVHNDAVGSVAEARWYGAQFLMQATDHLPYSMTEEVLRAAACYAGEHDLMWDAWNTLGGNGNPDACKQMADPAARRRLADIILKSRDKYAEAAEHIERALAR